MDDANGNDDNFVDFVNKNLMSTLDEGTYYTLKPSVIASLDILPKLKPDGLPDSSSTVGVSSRSCTTLFAVVNRCRTISGQRLLTKWLQNPLNNKEKVDTRLDIVNHFVQNTQLRTTCYDNYLRKVPDLIRLAHKISREKCSISDLAKVYNVCKNMKQLCAAMPQLTSMIGMELPDPASKLFEWISSCCSNLDDFVKLIEDSVDLDTLDEAGDFMIKPNSDESIARILVEISNLSSKARQLMRKIADDIGLEPDKSLKLETDGEKGFALRVTKNNEQAVRNNPEYEQLSLVKKDGYRFTNRALTNLSNKYVDSKAEYNTLAKSVIDEIISKATMYDGEVTEFGVSVTLLDVFVALAVAADTYNYCRPLIFESDCGRIEIDKLRHPCVENQPDVENYVPNDVSFSKDGKKFYMITGPNMGGKSTFIKSVAMTVIMAQIGCMTPAEEAKISLVDGVYTRIGAGDSQMEGISTFMEEMMDMSVILSEATENSLVVIDELGRGTSTFDGFGLAWAISKNLATQIRCYTLFATHLHELTEMEEEVDIVGNMHVKAFCHDDKLTMLYSVDRGVCDESYGINVARYTKFPEHVVQDAQAKLSQFEEVTGFGNKREVRAFIRECIRDSQLTK